MPPDDIYGVYFVGEHLYPLVYRSEPEKKVEGPLPDYIIPEPYYKVKEHICTKPHHIMMWNRYRESKGQLPLISHHTKNLVNALSNKLCPDRIILIWHKHEISIGPIAFTDSQFTASVYKSDERGVRGVPSRNEIIYNKIGYGTLIATFSSIEQYLNEVEV